MSKFNLTLTFRFLICLLSFLINFHFSTTVRADNLEQFVLSLPHPICGINEAYPDPPLGIKIPPNVPKWAYSLPFRKCPTMANGIGVNALNNGSVGKDTLASLLIQLVQETNWNLMFKPLNTVPLTCRPINPPLGQEPLRDISFEERAKPICTVSILKDWMATYENRSDVKGLKRLEKNINQINLSSQSMIDQLQSVKAAIIIANGNMTFDQLANLLE